MASSSSSTPTVNQAKQYPSRQRSPFTQVGRKSAFTGEPSFHFQFFFHLPAGKTRIEAERGRSTVRLPADFQLNGGAPSRGKHAGDRVHRSDPATGEQSHLEQHFHLPVGASAYCANCKLFHYFFLSSFWLDIPTGTWSGSLQLSVCRAFPQLLIEGLCKLWDKV